MGDALSLPMAEIATRLGEGKLKARALAEEAIANHERFGESLMAYSQWAPDHARKCADAADAAFAVGARAGSLQGIPTSIKDLFAVAGFPTYAGSPKRLPAKFETEGPLVAGLRRQLATVMGKTHMVEFAFGGTGHNAHYGSARNPWDATAHRSPGGSSSGAGERINRGADNLINAVLAAVPEPGIGNADADAVDAARHAAQESKAVAKTGIERGEAEARIRHAARQDAGRIEGKAQRHDALGRPALLRQLQAGIAGHRRRQAH